ncbi:hypothetical protein RHIZO_05070 [Rhizobiaceae bacterium]|nr:hypothetical protein RHIZO_05070 [Rhizobiaceae bacterium]
MRFAFIAHRSLTHHHPRQDCRLRETRRAGLLQKVGMTHERQSEPPALKLALMDKG